MSTQQTVLTCRPSTDKNANYAQELVDARVDNTGKTYGTAGENVRAIGRVRSMQNIMKVCIFILVGISSVIDTQIIGEGAALRTALIFWAISNEGLSILENCAVIGLPVPEKLKAMLIQLVDENHAAKLNGKTSEEKKQ